MSTAEWSEHRRCLLSGNGLGVDKTLLFDGSNIWIGPQSLEFGRGEGTSKTVDDVPLVSNRGSTIDLTRECVDIGFAASTILEGNDVSSGDGLLGLPHLNEGRRNGESGENVEGEDDEVLGEHVDDAGCADKEVLKLGGG